MTKIYVLASDDHTRRVVKEATEWFDEENQNMFDDDRTVAVRSVAEYILNTGGFTMYTVNAKYPKEAVS